ncbi:MAG: hypothetical protein GY705_08550, partial [Bacteroidetes bacterium]|nr:hypothetical protein [Bacteroidota bacterium]
MLHQITFSAFVQDSKEEHLEVTVCAQVCPAIYTGDYWDAYEEDEAEIFSIRDVHENEIEVQQTDLEELEIGQYRKKEKDR